MEDHHFKTTSQWKIVIILGLCLIEQLAQQAELEEPLLGIHHFQYKIHHFKYKFIIFNAKFIIFDAKFIFLMPNSSFQYLD